MYMYLQYVEHDVGTGESLGMKMMCMCALTCMTVGECDIWRWVQMYSSEYCGGTQGSGEGPQSCRGNSEQVSQRHDTDGCQIYDTYM